MLKVSSIFSNFQRAMLVVGILTGVGLYLQGRDSIVKIAIRGIAGCRLNAIPARYGWSITHPPGGTARPKGRHTLLLARWKRDQCIQGDLIKRIGILLSAGVRPLGWLTGRGNSILRQSRVNCRFGCRAGRQRLHKRSPRHSFEHLKNALPPASSQSQQMMVERWGECQAALMQQTSWPPGKSSRLNFAAWSIKARHSGEA